MSLQLNLFSDKLTIPTDTVPGETKVTISKKFAKARDAYHAARRRETARAFSLMVRFIKARDGDVATKEIEKLFHEWSMPYPSKLYRLARKKAGVPPRKEIDRKKNQRIHFASLSKQFRLLVEATPERDRPKLLTPTPPATAKIKAAAKPVVATPALPVIEDLPSDYLFACATEWKRRWSKAREILAISGE